MKTVFLFLMLVSFTVNVSLAQANDEDMVNTVFEKDSLFWSGYNTCNHRQMGQFIADDIEFYHDKGGITLGRSGLIDSIKKNLCSNENFRTRREAVAGTVKVYLLKNSNVTYGAIISGEHYFFNS